MDIEFDSIRIGLENCDSYEIPRELVSSFYIDGIEHGIWAHKSGCAEDYYRCKLVQIILKKEAGDILTINDMKPNATTAKWYIPTPLFDAIRNEPSTTHVSIYNNGKCQYYIAVPFNGSMYGNLSLNYYEKISKTTRGEYIYTIQKSNILGINMLKLIRAKLLLLPLNIKMAWNMIENTLRKIINF